MVQDAFEGFRNRKNLFTAVLKSTFAVGLGSGEGEGPIGGISGGGAGFGFSGPGNSFDAENNMSILFMIAFSDRSSKCGPSMGVPGLGMLFYINKIRAELTERRSKLFLSPC